MKPMYIRRIVFLALLLTWGLVAQTLDPNSITVSATRSIDIPAEQVQFRLSVVSDASVDQVTVLNALRNAGLTTAAFQSVTSNIATADGLTFLWTYTVQTPYARLSDQFNTLQKAVQTLAKGKPKLRMGFVLIGSSVSDATIQDQRRGILPDLLADANKNATTLANAAGFSLGPILSLADISGRAIGAGVVSAAVFYDPSDPNLTYLPATTGSASSIVTLSYQVTVKYALR